MSLQFDETMAGTVATAQGPRAFSFHVRAFSDASGVFGGAERMALTGSATLEGVAEAAPLLDGSSLEIGIPYHDYLRYQVAFEGRDGARYRFVGQKTVRLLRIVRTMTTLHGQLFRDGVEIGSGTLRFDLKTLPRFLSTWRFRPSRR